MAKRQSPQSPQAEGSGAASRAARHGPSSHTGHAETTAPAEVDAEVRTHRLVLCGNDASERAVIEVVDGQVSLRLAAGPVPAGSGNRHSSEASLVLFAAPGSGGIGPLAGMQVWANGTVVASFEAWSDSPGCWESSVCATSLRTPSPQAPSPPTPTGTARARDQGFPVAGADIGTCRPPSPGAPRRHRRLEPAHRWWRRR